MTPHAQAVGVIKAVSTHFNVPIPILLGDRRTEPAVLYRQVAMFLCRQLTSLSLTEVGALFGRHHTTVLHAENKIHRVAVPGERSWRGDLARDIYLIRKALGR
jgi:chromosomal replication initiator protein